MQSRLRELTDILGPDCVAEIVRLFASEATCQLAALQELAQTPDRRGVQRLAHSLGGAARNVGAMRLAQRAMMLEQNTAALAPAAIVMAVSDLRAEAQAAMVALQGFVIAAGASVASGHLPAA